MRPSRLDRLRKKLAKKRKSIGNPINHWHFLDIDSCVKNWNKCELRVWRHMQGYGWSVEKDGQPVGNGDATSMEEAQGFAIVLSVK